MNETFFSSAAFAEAWCAHLGENQHPFPISTGQGTVFGVATVGRTGLCAVQFAPEGFYGSLGGDGMFDQSQLADALAQLQARRVRRFVWNVRFDQQDLAAALEATLPDVSRHTTQVVTLQSDHERTFARYNATMRNQVRKARKSGVQVRVGGSREDWQSYYSIHQRHAARRGGFDYLYPQAFLEQLVDSASRGRLLLAAVGDRVAAGGIFLRDGNSVYYFHGAYDPEFSKQYPTCAVIDAAIEWAHRLNAATFNMGGSAGLESLERFKSFWGAETLPTWRFTWRNPLWNRFDGATEWIRKLVHNA